MFGLPVRILCEQSIPLVSRKGDEHALDFAHCLCRLFSVSVFCASHVRLMLSSPIDCLIFARVSVVLCCTKFDVVHLLNPSHQTRHTTPKSKGVKMHASTKISTKLKLNSMARVRERTIPTERPPIVGEVIPNCLRIEGATWSA
jgi:hypothetical protein